MKRWCTALVFLLSAVLTVSCSVRKDNMEKQRDIEFTVIDPAEMPEELSAVIKEERGKPFKLTYGDKGYLYLARGYGEHETSGYSVEVEECYETENLICVRTNLLGPLKDEEIQKKSTYPYVVIKIEYMEKDVVFD